MCALSGVKYLHQACQTEALFCGGISSSDVQVLRLWARTRTGCGATPFLGLQFVRADVAPGSSWAKLTTLIDSQWLAVRIDTHRPGNVDHDAAR